MNRIVRVILLTVGFLQALSCNKPADPQPQPGPEDIGGPLKIVFITDTHYGQSATANSDMQMLIDDINRLEGVDFVLMGGDLTNIGSDVQIAGAKALLDKLKKPCYVVPGNHDSKWSENGCSTFGKTFGYEKFEFEAGGYRFLGCASGPDQRMALALVSNEHLRWLNSLQKGKPVIFLNHYPLDSDMSNWFEVRKELIRLGCQLVIGGHVHGNQKYNYDGLPGFTGRTALRGSGLPAYNIITIEDGKVTVCERRVSETGSEELTPWFDTQLKDVQDNLSYDADGLPENYPWMKYSDNASYPEVRVRWSIKDTDNIWSGFDTDGQTAWYTTASGKVCALSLADGSVKWTKQYNGKIWATPSLGNGTLIFTCSNGSVYAVDAASGTDKWEYPCESKVASPVVYGDAVYVGDSKSAFRALNLSDGKLLWKCTGIAGFCDAAPYVDASRVITGSWGGTLYSMETATGKLQWKWARSSGFLTTPGACPPLKAGNRLFVACPDRVTYCLDATKGTTLYSVEGGRESLALSEDMSTLFIKNIETTAKAINVTNESIIWEVETGLGKDIASSALACCSDLVLIPSDKGYLLALDAATGALRWRHKVGLGLVNPVTAWKDGDKILILASSADGRIELLEI